ncbi:hypothetical protein H2203_000745 [Taxawa tesnikishii (nom. ined.)]|nr:hypothetical protein H2203_000745 [Dothideales sp. JES 119]
MDYELELGAIVGKPVGRGDIVSAKDGAEHIFGFVLINDWSARDIQQLEMNPLGPLNGKNLGTSMSPWIVTYDALEPFRVSAQARQQPVAPYLDDPKSTAVALELQVEVQAQGEGGNVDGSSSITVWPINRAPGVGFDLEICWQREP